MEKSQSLLYSIKKILILDEEIVETWPSILLKSSKRSSNAQWTAVDEPQSMTLFLVWILKEIADDEQYKIEETDKTGSLNLLNSMKKVNKGAADNCRWIPK